MSTKGETILTLSVNVEYRSLTFGRSFNGHSVENMLVFRVEDLITVFSLPNGKNLHSKRYGGENGPQ